MRRMTWARVGGHRIGAHVYEFPHLCPGVDCAIAAWMAAKHRKKMYEQLMPYGRRVTPRAETDLDGPEQEA